MQLNEGFGYQDLKKMLKPEIHIDEFASKMGDDDKISVVSFLVKAQAAAADLVNWFETGYDFVLDADKSPGEIKHNRYVVYVEIERRTSLPKKINEMIEDLQTLTEFEPRDWAVVYGKEKTKMPFSVETLSKLIPLSPKEYRERNETDLNSVREAAGIAPVSVYDRDEKMKNMQEQAGII